MEDVGVNNMGGYKLYTQADDEQIVMEISDRLVQNGIIRNDFAEKLQPLKAQAAMHEQACIIRRMSEYGMGVTEIASILKISERSIEIILDMGGENEYNNGVTGILKPLSLKM